MDRQPPRATNDEIDLYIRTYYSLLRSSGEVMVRAFEEAHTYSSSSLHAGARDPVPDVAAFGYSAARLPAAMPLVRRIVMGQSHEHFERAALPVQTWRRLRTRGRRRPLRWNGGDTLAVFLSSTSDIDDLIPIVTAYQIEWNKLHDALGGTPDPERLGLDPHGLDQLRAALGPEWKQGLAQIAARRCDLSVRLLAGTYEQYQRASQRWWSGIEPAYLRPEPPRRRPIYFVSSNTHSLVNLLGGYAREHQGQIVDFARRADPEGLAEPLSRALASGDDALVANLTYYLLRTFLRDKEEDEPRRVAEVQAWDAESGITSLDTPGQLDVAAQLIDIAALRPDRMDPRVRLPGDELLSRSDAVILNIDYPLGMAAYHHLSRVAQGVGEIRGLYVMGKAATLNGRVGDVIISSVVHDEHSGSTYLFKNCFSAQDVQPWLRAGTVLDGQKAVAVRGPFLQNRDYMSVFYREGYTVLEMEAGPYLSALYEMVSPKRYPTNEVVHLSTITPFDVGVLHYASDTPYSKRESLLSKSLSFFGVDSTYASAVAMVRQLLKLEIARIQRG